MQLESHSGPNGAFLPPPPKGSSCTMLGRTLQGHLGLAALPGVDRLDYGNRAHGKAVSLPASPNFLPVSKLGKNFRWGWLHTQIQRTESREGLLSRASCRLPQRSLTLLAQQHHHYETCGNKSHDSQWFVLIHLGRKCFHHKPLNSFACLYTATSFPSALRIYHNHNVKP